MQLRGKESPVIREWYSLQLRRRDTLFYSSVEKEAYTILYIGEHTAACGPDNEIANTGRSSFQQFREELDYSPGEEVLVTYSSLQFRGCGSLQFREWGSLQFSEWSSS